MNRYKKQDEKEKKPFLFLKKITQVNHTSNLSPLSSETKPNTKLVLKVYMTWKICFCLFERPFEN